MKNRYTEKTSVPVSRTKQEIEQEAFAAGINFAIEHAGKITSAKMARYGNTDPGVIGAEDVTNALEDLTKETEE
jgi:hypothetical protein